MTFETGINGQLYDLQSAFGLAHVLAAFPGFDPDTGHLGFDFAAAILPDTAAGPVAQGLGAVHGAGHTR